MKVIRTMKPRTAGGGTAASSPPSAAPVPKPVAPSPQQPAEEGALAPGPERGLAAEETGSEGSDERQIEPEEGPGGEDLVPDE